MTYIKVQQSLKYVCTILLSLALQKYLPWINFFDKINKMEWRHGTLEYVLYMFLLVF